MVAPAIEIDHVSKRFRLYQEKYTSLKERVIHLGHTPFEEFWALWDISLEIGQGETVGLLGHNGSGKSTLLKCIAAILQPTSGKVVVRGSLAAMLELGAGFHPDLSGRDNVYLNASLLGMPRREVDRRFDEIVAFAELDKFIDNQIKYYSSGMQARLGFAVAVTFEPNVLLIDEVLAVGDENFQRKCLDRIKHFQSEGRTIVFVSHAPDLVRMICNRAFVLDHGRLVGEGTAGEAIRVFREHLLNSGEVAADEVAALVGEAGEPEDGAPAQVPDIPALRPRSHKVQIGAVEFDHPGAGTRRYLLSGDPLTVRVGYEATQRVDDAVFGIAIYDIRGELVYGCNTELLGHDVGPVLGPGEVQFRFDSVPLLDGTYGVTFGVESARTGEVYDWSEQQHHFEVMNPGRAVGAVALPMRTEVRPSYGPSTLGPAPVAGGGGTPLTGLEATVRRRRAAQ